MKIEKVNLTEENLLKIQDIDDLFYTNAITGINWYLKRYNEHHTAYVLVDKKDNFCGYVVAVPIKKELYDAIINGVITNDIHINPKMFVNKSKYYYLYSIVLLEKYRYRGWGTKLLNKLLEEIKDKKYCVLTVSKDGYNIMNKCMDIKIKIDDSIFVFVNKKVK